MSRTVPCLPDQVLHLIRTYVAPQQYTVSDEKSDQPAPLYRPIISLSLMSQLLTRIPSFRMATNNLLTDRFTRWELLLHTVRKFLSRGNMQDERVVTNSIRADESIGHTTTGDLVTESSQSLAITSSQETSDTESAERKIQELETDDDKKESCDSLYTVEHEDTEEEYDDDESDGWSERDYEEDSEESDWDSEDDSDYEDDWEAEYGFSIPTTSAPVKQIVFPATEIPVQGRSLLDF
ncbi:hypothetical protein BDW02DRAFT_567966 [Decorospora gaudefroyi]|uniref:Uncharacterized protein n=1 Tax=Decorospora gaudefroyi TaxID=184978 RepID=A0A6A5KBZ7_9PLEO|nr:hypothetical protein BDW02DRAFT_567966 [Decorospora gaudefroyi]